jgi:hypothetical protein
MPTKAIDISKIIEGSVNTQSGFISVSVNYSNLKKSELAAVR